MKNMKKLLALMLALAMSLMMFTACSNADNDDSEEETKQEEKADKEKDEEKEADDETAVKEVVEAYVKASAELDGEAAAEYISEDSDIYEGTKQMTRDYVCESLVSEMGLEDEYKEEVEDVISGFIDIAVDAIEYEIGEISVDDDTATAEYTMTTPDFETAFDNLNPDEVFTEDEIAEIQAEAEGLDTEDEKAMTEFSIDIVKRMIEKIDVSDIETTEQALTIELEKIDGEWLVVADE